MGGYSDNYNSVFEIYVNKHIISFPFVREEVKGWLVNERENKKNSLEVEELKGKLNQIIDCNTKIIAAIEFIEICSFNLNIEFVKDIFEKANEIRCQLSLDSVVSMINIESYIEQVVEKIKKHMSSTYQEKSYNELLSKLTDKDFTNTLNSNPLILKDKLNELRYTSIGNEARNKILKQMLYNLGGLEITQKHVYEFHKRENKIHEADLQKHFGIENALIDDLKELKKLEQ